MAIAVCEQQQAWDSGWEPGSTRSRAKVGFIAQSPVSLLVLYLPILPTHSGEEVWFSVSCPLNRLFQQQLFVSFVLNLSAGRWGIQAQGCSTQREMHLSIDPGALPRYHCAFAYLRGTNLWLAWPADLRPWAPHEICPRDPAGACLWQGTASGVCSVSVPAADLPIAASRSAPDVSAQLWGIISYETAVWKCSECILFKPRGLLSFKKDFEL